MSNESETAKKAEVNIFKGRRNGNLLTAKQVESMFDITPTTLHNWRKKAQFPAHHLHAPGLKKPPCRFDEGEIKYWAELNNVAVINPIVEEAIFA